MSLPTLESPAGTLVTPVSQSAGYINELRLGCGVIMGGVDWFVESVAGFSPLEEWVFKPLAGDWDAFDRGEQAWRAAGDWAETLSKDLAALPTYVDDRWTGETAASFGTAARKVTAQAEAMPTSCREMATMVAALNDAAKAVAALIAALLGELADTCTEILLSLAVPGGQVTTPVWVGKLAARLTSISVKISSAVLKFRQLVARVVLVAQRLRAAVTGMRALRLVGAAPLLSTAASGATARPGAGRSGDEPAAGGAGDGSSGAGGARAGGAGPDVAAGVDRALRGLQLGAQTVWTATEVADASRTVGSVRDSVVERQAAVAAGEGR